MKSNAKSVDWSGPLFDLLADILYNHIANVFVIVGRFVLLTNIKGETTWI